MPIRHIKVTNFKSFKELDIDIRAFNVVIGANASGKSNFIDILRFLRDIAQSGLKNAISMQGGTEYLRNVNIGNSQNTSFEVVADQDATLFMSSSEKNIFVLQIKQIIYRFDLVFARKGGGYNVVQEELILKGDISHVNSENNDFEVVDKGEIIIYNLNNSIAFNISTNNEIKLGNNNLLSLLNRSKIPPKSLFFEHLNQIMIGPSLAKIFSSISIYDFDPKLPKKAVSITGKTELEEDGGNLAIVLKDILEDANNRRKFNNLMKDILPFVNDINVEKFTDKSLMLNIKETYTQQRKEYFPASLMSDGTINIVALIIALYFESSPITIIEEPERNVHPYLMARISSFLKEASKKKQIIVTTHNPEIVKHTNIDDILLVSRCKEGYSTLSRPSERNHIKTFLQHEIGLEELYVQNLLGA